LGLADAAIRGIATSVAFRASAAPYLVLDTDLRIRAANVAYQQAMHHDIADMVGEFMFDVFPDNPATPDARSVERLAASFERAMFRGESDRMELQRYDVVDGGEGFVEKSWLPVNSPLRDAEGRTLGVLHHVEDVTRFLVTTALERDLLAPQPPGPRGASLGSRGVVEALQRDSLERRTRAQMLVHNAHHAMERMSRRFRDEDEPT
jgi:hypothetical protein